MSTVKVNELSTYSGTDISIETGKTVSGTASQFKMTDVVQGDVLYGSAADTLSRLAPGTSGQYLQTTGAAANPVWATVAPNKPAFHVYLTATQSIPNTTNTKIELDTAILDTASGFNLTASGTNPYSYTVSVAGTYLIQTGLAMDDIDDGEYARLMVYKNGVRTNASDVIFYSSGSNQTTFMGKCFMESLAVDDYIALWVYQNEGGSLNIAGTHQFLSGFKLF